MAIKIFILDFDGTLADTTGVILRTQQGTIKELGLPARSDEQCTALIGLPLDVTVKTLFPEGGFDPALYQATYRRLFKENEKLTPAPLYEGVLETLKALKDRGLVLTIASSRNKPSLLDYCHRLGFEPYINYVLGAGDVEKPKPEPDPVLKTLEDLGFSGDEALVVGDTPFDVLMGVRAGAHAFGVSYGNGSPAEMTEAGAERILDSFSELLDLI